MSIFITPYFSLGSYSRSFLNGSSTESNFTDIDKKREKLMSRQDALYSLATKISNIQSGKGTNILDPFQTYNSIKPSKKQTNIYDPPEREEYSHLSTERKLQVYENEKLELIKRYFAKI